MKNAWLLLAVLLALVLAVPASAAPQFFTEHTIKDDFWGGEIRLRHRRGRGWRCGCPGRRVR